MEPFSLRHGKALLEKRIRVTMGERLRKRLWLTVQKYNEQYWHQPDPSDNWSAQTSHLAQTEVKLGWLLGQITLTSRADEGAVGIEGYFLKGYPSCTLDVMEQFLLELTPDQASSFQEEVNASMVAFECPWWLSDGRFFQVDAAFFNEEIIQKSRNHVERTWL